ncbi:hypothetical protein [Roseofilum casamattae]|uniref:Uncharacterized protein n=1 Tax=Roseofilum casamattae BLCC-M143 TaxID=3022442 RepID=A0ABT7BUA6_9CYAN|nr:hypothetical protein [Roseofilum casamattae]MDJ1182769.1 hypothetical protein [Roseofilum casamattae BLCC-M143]
MYRFPIGTCLWSLVSVSLIVTHPLPVARALPSPLLSQASTVQNLPQSIVDAVRWDFSIEIGVHPDRISLVDATLENWPDTCLGLSAPGEFCGGQIIPGWRITLSDGRYARAYRTDMTGQQRRIEALPSPNAFPLFLGELVLQAVSTQSKEPIESLEIENAIAQSWSDTCLELDGDNCLAIQVPGWEIAIVGQNPRQRWTYRTNEDGSLLRAVLPPSSINSGAASDLPEAVAQAVLKDLARRRRLPIQALEILEATAQTWSDSCLGIQLWNRDCQEQEIEGWRVVVSTPRRRWVYRSNAEGQILYPEPGNTSSSEKFQDTKAIANAEN